MSKQYFCFLVTKTSSIVLYIEEKNILKLKRSSLFCRTQTEKINISKLEDINFPNLNSWLIAKIFLV